MRRTLASIFVLLNTFAVVYAGNNQRAQTNKAHAFYEKGKYVEAVALYSALDNPTLQIQERIAHCHYYLRDYAKASRAYAVLVKNSETEAVCFYRYAEVLIAEGNYKKAKEFFLRYQKLEVGAHDIGERIRSCEWALAQDTGSPKFRLTNTDLPIDGISLGVAIFEKGLVYAQPKTPSDSIRTNYYELVYAKQKNKYQFYPSEPLNLPSQFYASTACFSNDGKKIFYTTNKSSRDQVRSGQGPRHNIGKNGINGLKICRAELQGGNWVNSKDMSFDGLEYSCAHPTISKDGNTMFFASNRPGGTGGYDIYKCTRDGDKWGTPVNLGNRINTIEDDAFPYLDGNTLYFSSKGHLGFGGYDVYSADLGKTENVRNMGWGINSERDDFSIVFTERRTAGYISSNRGDNNGKDRIYHFDTVVVAKQLNLTVLHKISEKPLQNIDVEVKSSSTGGEAQRSKTDAEGRTKFLLYPDEEYTIELNANGYENKTFTLTQDDPRDYLTVLLNQEIKTNTVINLDNILFDLGSEQYTPQSEPILERLTKFMKEQPGVSIELSAHTDCRGGDKYNMELSNARARSCAKYLDEHGISKIRVTNVGYGERDLLNRCEDGVDCTEEEHTINRRVEIKILGTR